MKCVIKFLNWVNWLSLAVELLLKTNTRLYSVPYENIPLMSQQSFGKSHKNGPETHPNLVNTARTKHSSTTPRGRQSEKLLPGSDLYSETRRQTEAGLG